jgi:hypothetical protein
MLAKDLEKGNISNFSKELNEEEKKDTFKLEFRDGSALKIIVDNGEEVE